MTESYKTMGHLEKILREGKFAVTTELTPPDSANPQEVFDEAAMLANVVDAFNATDGSGAHCHMSSISICSLLPSDSCFLPQPGQYMRFACS